MKILFITEYTEWGGGEQNLLGLAHFLRNSGHDVYVLAPLGRVYEEAQRMGINAIPLQNFFQKRWFSFIPLPSFKYSSLLLDKDIVHTYSINSLPLTIGFKSKVIHTIHGPWEKPVGLRAFFMKMFARKFTCVSKSVLEETSDQLQASVIYLGVDKIELPAVNRGASVKSIGVIGRFQKIKGQDIFVESLKQIDDLLQGVTIHFYGIPNPNIDEDIFYYERVKEMAAKLQLKVLFHGFEANKDLMYLNLDLVVIPSRYESFSIVAIECLSRGIPIIGPNVGGPKEIIYSSDIGLTFVPDNVESLAKTIRRAILDYKLFNPTLIQKRACDFSLDKQASLLLKYYEQ